ncbi:MAG: HEAT repeat domain-containing protein [Candidatus Hydrogenedentota bacterium]
MTRRGRFAVIAGGIALGCGLLIFLGTWSSPILVELSTPDVDSLLREYANARSDAEARHLREQIHGLGYPAAQRLTEIARDTSWTIKERCASILLLRANPIAAFDVLELVDDPDSQISGMAREIIGGCMSAGYHPRNPQSDTTIRLLQRWRNDQRDSGFGAIPFGGTPSDSFAGKALSTEHSSPKEIFEQWTKTRNIKDNSPFLRDLKGLGPKSTECMLRIVQHDTEAVRRSMAIVILGLLEDSSAIKPLQALLASTQDPVDRKFIWHALRMLKAR